MRVLQASLALSYYLTTASGFVSRSLPDIQPAILLSDCGLFRCDNCHDDIDEQHGGSSQEDTEHEQQSHDGRVNIEIISQSGAHTRDHAVGAAASKGFVASVHSALLMHLLPYIRSGTRGVAEKVQPSGDYYQSFSSHAPEHQLINRTSPSCLQFLRRVSPSATEL